MNLIEAYTTLDLNYGVSEQDLKDNFRWLVKFYHPDTPITGNAVEFKKIIKAYNLIRTGK
jgi:DnaJ-class molecular chaperone